MDSSFLVIGSGAGGATVAKELASRGAEVTVVEKGGMNKLGTSWRALKFYSGSFRPGEMSAEGTELLRTIMIGGSTMVTLGNGVRALQTELKDAGVDIDKELKEAERELKVVATPESFFGARTRILRDSSIELGYDVKPMPKFVDFKRCRMCGACVLGCRYGAKWTSLNMLGEARKMGAKLIRNAEVEKVIQKGGEVKGVQVRDSSGVHEIDAQKIVLAAGGLRTPPILQKSGLDAGEGLFADLFVVTYGLLDKRGMGEEIGMATVINEFHENHGFIISPIMDVKLDMLLSFPLSKKSIAFKRDRLLGLMTKIADDPSGRVLPSGGIEKPVTSSDLKKLEKGIEVSEQILSQAGAESKSIFVSKVRGAHLGGTAALGRIVNKDFETEISGLYVCDASILPYAPGNPPVLTIVALAKKLSSKLAGA
ncbi:MAG: GMC family oxidoreductase [Thaumarchaeota archaeon]|nr:GMC family oxidoreductase [Nitrososphaerota archaeon]